MKYRPSCWSLTLYRYYNADEQRRISRCRPKLIEPRKQKCQNSQAFVFDKNDKPIKYSGETAILRVEGDMYLIPAKSWPGWTCTGSFGHSIQMIATRLLSTSPLSLSDHRDCARGVSSIVNGAGINARQDEYENQGQDLVETWYVTIDSERRAVPNWSEWWKLMNRKWCKPMYMYWSKFIMRKLSALRQAHQHIIFSSMR